jgi:hypothetical protein
MLPYLLISLMLVALAADIARRTRSSLRAVPDSAQAATTPSTPVLACIGRVGQPLVAPTRAALRLAPEDEHAVALEMSVRMKDEPVRVGITDVAMVRGWSGGLLLLDYGTPVRGGGLAWPMGPNLAGWELHLVTKQGDSIRCYGAPRTTCDAELAALAAQLSQSQALRAS